MKNIANTPAINPQSKWWYVLGAVVLIIAVLLGCYAIFFTGAESRTEEKPASKIAPTPDEQTENTSESHVKPVMNVPDIMTGHYETIAGTWVNAADDRLIINDDSITWKVAGEKIAIDHFSLTPKYAKSPIIGTVTRNNSSAKITWNAPTINGFGHSYSLGFYPDGTKILSNDSTKLDKFYDAERIVALPGNADARYWVDNQNIEPFIYYRVTDQEHISAVRDAAANVPAMHNITCTAPTPHAFPCAGSPAPEDALEIPVISQYENLDEINNRIVAGLKFPAQNTYCDFTIDDANPAALECMDYVWTSHNGKSPAPPLPPGTPHFGIPTINSHGGEIPKYEGHRSEAMQSKFGEVPNEYVKPPLVIESGQTATYENWVCAAQPDVLTCWNTVTGHGVAFGDEVFETF